MSGVVFVSALLALAVGVFGMRYTGVFSDFVKAVHDGDEWRQWQESIRGYREYQYQAVQEWLDQPCTLEQIMQRFQESDREYPRAWSSFPSRVQQCEGPQSDEERHYRLILPRLETILYGHPNELAAARHRLEKEHQQLQARD
jgi:hypothetical protein